MTTMRVMKTKKMVNTMRAMRPTMETAVMSSGFSLLEEMRKFQV